MFQCEVRDRGWIDDPLAGRERPSDLRGGGRGLWIVNHLCDLVQVRSSASGSVVRLQMSLA
jgi:anti-sigma regulatory factor (Ser/Thr protein kinase)